MDYRLLNAQDAIDLRVKRVHVLESRLFSVYLEIEEIGGPTPDMEREVRDLQARLAVHVGVLWPEADARESDGAPDGASGDQAPGDRAPGDQAPGAAQLHDELGARRDGAARIDGDNGFATHGDDGGDLPDVLAHEEDDLPDVAHRVPETPSSLDGFLDPVDPSTPLGHVERDASIVNEHDEPVPIAGRPDDPALLIDDTEAEHSAGPGSVSADNDLPGRHQRSGASMGAAASFLV